MATLYDTLFTWRIPPASEQKLQTARAIVTQSTGREKDQETPGRGNFILADVTHALWQRLKIPVLPQIEVRFAEKLRRGTGFPAAFTADQTEDGKSTMSWNTYVVARLQKEWLEKNGIPLRAILVASPIHMGRAVWVYEKLGFTVFPAFVPTGQYFDSRQDQWWLRCAAGVYVYEFLCRLLFLYKGWI